MSLEELIASIRSNQFAPSSIASSLGLQLLSTVLPPYEWDRPAFEAELNVTAPATLDVLWRLASELRLFEDVLYGQWGLVIWGADVVVQRQAIREERSDDFRDGDLVIGEFLGDGDLVILRCDQEAADFGSVLVALPIDRRESWYGVSPALDEFLYTFMAQGGAKFWES